MLLSQVKQFKSVIFPCSLSKYPSAVYERGESAREAYQCKVWWVGVQDCTIESGTDEGGQDEGVSG